MENKAQQIKFYQKRDFGDTLNAGFSFIRENIKPLFSAVLGVAGPFALLTIILTLYWTSDVYGNLANLEGADVETNGNEFTAALSLVSQFFGGAFWLLILTNVLFTLFGYISVISYVKLHYQAQGPITLADLWRESLSHAGSVFLIGLLYYLAVAASSILLLLPGIFLAVYWSLAPTLAVLENKGVGALGRSGDLLSGNWWRTFGFIFVAGLIATVVSLAFALPGTLLGASVGFFSTADMLAQDSFEAFSVINILSTLFSAVGNLFVFIIFGVPVCFYVGTLIEEKESKGLMAEINADPTEANQSNEGEY